MADLKTYDKEEVGRLVAKADEQDQLRAECAKKIHDLHDQGESKAWDQVQHLQYRQVKEKHDWHKEEFDRIMSAVKAMETTKPMTPEAKKKVPERSMLDRWIRLGVKGMTEDELRMQDAILKSSGQNEISPGEKVFAPWDMRIFNVNENDGTGRLLRPDATNEATLVQDIVEQGVIDTLHDFGGAMECVTVMHTQNGNTISYPVYDDGATLANNNEPAANIRPTTLGDPIVDITSTINDFALRKIGAHPFNTGFVDISRYMSEDVDWDVGAFVRRTLLRRMGRRIERELARGPGGSTGPQGFMGRAGDVLAADQTDNNTGVNPGYTLSWEDLITLVHSVDKAYLHGEMGTYGYAHKPGKVAFLTSWTVSGELQKLSDGDNRPIWMPSVSLGGYPTILGYPLHICQEFSAADQLITPASIADARTNGTTRARPIMFGNFGYFVARFSGPGLMIEQHYDSATAVRNHYRYMGRIRFDAECIGPLETDADSNENAGVPGTPAATVERCPAFKALTFKREKGSGSNA